MRILLCLLLAAFTAHAYSKSVSQTEENTNSHALPSEKLDAIRLIGRNVLQAKNTTKEESSDKVQLNQLRAALDALIAVETPALRPGVVHISGKTATPDTQQIAAPTVRKAAQTQAWDEVSKLRQGAGQLRRRKNIPAKSEVYSSGFPVGEQHGRLYEEFADKLEAILNNNSPNRVSQLHNLRDEVKAKKHGKIDTPLAHETPTLQVTPWEEPVVLSKQAQHKIKSSH